MATATMTTKEQPTVPLEVRRRLGLDAGDRLRVSASVPQETRNVLDFEDYH